ncbi:MAG: flavodoxin [Paludibacteraceae bacterium]
MNKTAIFFGTSTGNTENAAKIMAAKLGADIYDVANNPIGKISEYEKIILGSSTLSIGELQDDWEGFLPELAKADLTGKTIALFGLGDAYSYPDSFVDALGIIYEKIKNKGCTIVGAVDTEGYSFDFSAGVIDGKFVGLPLDDDNESELTNERIDKWIEEISQDFN